MANIEKYTQELPGTAIRFGKKVWEVSQSNAGAVGSIYAGVAIQLPSGEEFVHERYLTLEEREEACQTLWGFARVVAALAREGVVFHEAVPVAQEVEDVLQVVEIETKAAELEAAALEVPGDE